MKSLMQLFLKILFGIALFWGLLTLFVQVKNKTKSEVMGSSSAPRTAVVIYDADPLYNFDEQICASFAKGLSEMGWHVHAQTVKAALQAESDYDLYVFCANTYNFAPDDAVADYIKGLDNLRGKSAVAITLGSGTTDRAQRILEKIIKAQGANLLDSKAYWLMRPNDDDRMEESNVDVAVDMALEFGKEIGGKLEP